MKAMDMDTEILTRAYALIRIAEHVDVRVVTEMIAAWLRVDLTQATQTVMAVALLADEDKVRRQGHAAHEQLRVNDLPIPTEIADLEREYQRRRRAKNRRVTTQSEVV